MEFNGDKQLRYVLCTVRYISKLTQTQWLWHYWHVCGNLWTHRWCDSRIRYLKYSYSQYVPPQGWACFNEWIQNNDIYVFVHNYIQQCVTYVKILIHSSWQPSSCLYTPSVKVWHCQLVFKMLTTQKNRKNDLSLLSQMSGEKAADLISEARRCFLAPFWYGCLRPTWCSYPQPSRTWDCCTSSWGWVLLSSGKAYSPE